MGTERALRPSLPRGLLLFDRRGVAGGESARDATPRRVCLSFEPAISRSHHLAASGSHLWQATDNRVVRAKLLSTDMAFAMPLTKGCCPFCPLFPMDKTMAALMGHSSAALSVPHRRRHENRPTGSSSGHRPTNEGGSSLGHFRAGHPTAKPNRGLLINRGPGACCLLTALPGRTVNRGSIKLRFNGCPAFE